MEEQQVPETEDCAFLILMVDDEVLDGGVAGIVFDGIDVALADLPLEELDFSIDEVGVAMVMVVHWRVLIK